MRTVCTLTSIPQRINSIGKVLDSLHNQDRAFDAIYLTVPKTSFKGLDYPEIDANISSKVTIVEIGKDYGPITKLLGGLIREEDPDTLIISVDDDIIYPRTMVTQLLEHHEQYPNATVGSSGFIWGKFPFYLSGNYNQSSKNLWFNLKPGSKVDYLAGYAGIIYKRRFFPPVDDLKEKFLKQSINSKYLKFHDDIYISSYLCSKDIDRILVKCDHVKQYYLPNGLSHEYLKFAKTIIQAIHEAEDCGLFINFESTSAMNTTTGPFIIAIFLILLLAIAIGYIFYLR